MSRDEKLEAQLKLILGKARRSLSAAALLAQEGDLDFASSRTYYATLYAMQALLLTQSLSASSHSGVMRQFSQHFVKTTKFKKEYGKLVSRLSRKRHAGDYKFNVFFDLNEVLKDISDATEFVDAVENYLKMQGFLTSEQND